MYIAQRGSIPPEPTPEARATPSTGRRVAPAVVSLGVVSLLTDISSESVAAILPIYITAVVGMGPLAYGFVDGIYQGVSALVRLGGGWWADQSDRPKRVALAGYGLSAITRIGLIFASGFAAIATVVAVDRIGKGLRTAPRDALLATAAPPEHLGRNFGVHRAMDTAGAMIGPLIAVLILASFPFGLAGYQAVFVVSLAFALIGVATLALVVPDLRRGSGPGRPRPQWRQLHRPGMHRLLFAAGALGIATVGDGFLYLAVQRGGAISNQFFPLLFVGTGLAYLVLAVPAGRLADTIGRGKVFLAGHLLLLASYPVAALSTGAAGIVAVVLLLGSFYAATDGVLAALASTAVPPELRATGISAVQTVVALSRLVSSVLFGLLWQQAGLATAFVVMGALLAVALACCVGLLRDTTRAAA